MMRVPGDLDDAVFSEYATFAVEGRGRVTGETTQWF